MSPDLPSGRASDPSRRPAYAGCDGGCPLADAPGLDRRAFVSRSVLAAAAAALAACGGDGGDEPTAPAALPASAIRVADHPALASTGGVALVTVEGAQLAVVRTGDAAFVALSRVCPHQGAIVNAVTGGFLCPRHGARFGPTGAWTGGQRTTNLRSYPTSYDPRTGILAIG